MKQMTSADGEFCWVAEFCELDVADLDNVVPPEPSIDLSASGTAEPTLSLASAQYTTGPIEIAQLEAVGHLGSRSSSSTTVGVSAGLEKEVKERKPGIFAVGVGILTVCAVAIAAIGFRLDTGSLETESAGPLQTASTFAQSNEVDRSDATGSEDSSSVSDEALASTSSTSSDRPIEPISSDPFDRPETTSVAKAEAADNDGQTTPPSNNRSATTVRSSLVPPSARRATVPATTITPRTSRQAPITRRPTPTGSQATTRATYGEGASPSRSSSTATTRRTVTSSAPTTTSRSTTTSASRERTTTIRPGPTNTIDLQPSEVLQVGLEPPLDRVKFGAAALAADSARLDLLAVDKIANADGEGTPGVDVDVFTANSFGLRDRFVSSSETDADGIYRVEIPTGQGDTDGCYVMVFVAPPGVGFDASGQFREVQLCAPFVADDLPIVRTVDLGLDNEISESSRSIILTGGPVYLRGSVNSDAHAAQLEARFQGILSSAVVSDYNVVDGDTEHATDSEGAASGIASNRSLTSDQDQIYFKGRSQELFAADTAVPTDALEAIVDDLAAILGQHQKARLRVIVGADAHLGETDPSKQMLTDRAGAVVELLKDGEISADRLEARYATGRLTGRHLHGESMSNQVEFVLVWD